ncbi:MAG: undecaprenyl-diphosphate phosphatase [Candidatus Sumerlaeia bacterium]|nr:undecaprenyl-diphosphate phosphatase [Candidatus Sumerlaeia bacterium]
MTTLQAFVLGLVQALTEFLPVSSSGHLVLAQKAMQLRTDFPATFEVVVHLGTLLATLLVFWKPVWEMVVFFFGTAIRKPNACMCRTGAGWMIVLIVIGSIPAGVVGVLFEDQIEAMFSNALLVALALCATGAVLFATRWSRPRGVGVENVSLGRGLIVGVAQAIAITPGISRSGSTIAAGLLCGIDRETAARLSFLLSLPAVGGAALLKARDIGEAGAAIGVEPLLAGFVTSFMVGYLALKILLGFVRRGRLHWFAYYCWALGIAALIAWSMGYLR